MNIALLSPPPYADYGLSAGQRRLLQRTVQDYSQNGYDDGFEHDPNYSYDPNAGLNGGGVKDEKPDYDSMDEQRDSFKEEDYWTVINTFFEDKGLVRQQLESFNEFVETTIQEVVEDNKRLVLDQYQQYNSTDNREQAVSFFSSSSSSMVADIVS